MCELFAISSKRCIRINDYLEKFYRHSNEHPHGWGLAILQQNQSIIEKQPQKANDSQRLKQLLKQPIIVEHALAHIRLATMGYTDIFNCHPFNRIDNSGRTWTLIHNGTIFKYEPLNRYISQQTGDTDSERILMFILDRINEKQDDLNRSLTTEECFHLLEGIIRDLSENNKLNIMIFNGECLFIHANYKDSLYYLKAHDSIFLSTRPLSNENWKKFPINQLIGIKNSEIIFRGKKHSHEYRITEENFNFIMENMDSQLKQSIINNFGDLNYAREYKSTN